MTIARRPMPIAVATLVTIATALAVAALIAIAAPPPTRVRDALGLDRPGAHDERRLAEAVAMLTATCMERLGYPFVPVVEAPAPIPDADLDPIAWAGRWGFGVTTSVGVSEPVPQADPNLEMLTRMPPRDRDAATTALHGRDGRGGCHGMAVDAVHGLRSRLLAPLRAELDDLEERIERDPRSIGVDTAWQICIRPVGISDADRSTLGPRLIESFAMRLGAARDASGLAALQDEERRMAVVAAQCEAAYAAGRAALEQLHEAAFVRQHLGRLRAIGRAIRTAEAALPTLPPTTHWPPDRAPR